MHFLSFYSLSFRYYEDMEQSIFNKVGVIALGVHNSGEYQFSPAQLREQPGSVDEDSCEKFTFGVVKVTAELSARAG